MPQIYKILERWGARLQTPEIASLLQISGYAPEASHIFALLISMPPEFSLMPRLKSINFYQNKPKIELFLQKKIFKCWGLCLRPPNTAPSQLQISDYAPDTRHVLLILSSFRILQ